MDDPLSASTAYVTIPSAEMTKIIDAMARVSAAMDILGDKVDDASDIIYTTSRGGRAYSIDTEAIELEAEDDIDFLRNTRD